MPPTCSQERAHSSQISAHSRHVCLWWRVPMSMKLAEVWQISAQAFLVTALASGVSALDGTDGSQATEQGATFPCPLRPRGADRPTPVPRRTPRYIDQVRRAVALARILSGD